MPIDFKRVILPRTNSKAKVYVYGFAHGARYAAGSTREVVQALASEVGHFHTQDYVMAEGFHNDHAHTLVPNPSPEDLAEEEQLDHIGRFIKANFPGLLGRAERAEPFYLLIEAMADRRNFRERVDASAQAEAAEQPEAVQAVRGKTSLGLDEVSATKSAVAERLKHSVPEASAQEVDQFVEATTTFRSLLMARAAFHRAMARKTSVRLFCGFLHAEEVARFLERPKFLNEYLRNLSRNFPQLFQLYGVFEQVHGTTTKLFQTHSKKVAAEHHTQLLKWIAHKAQLHSLAQLRDQRQTRFSLDLSEFRPEN